MPFDKFALDLPNANTKKKWLNNLKARGLRRWPCILSHTYFQYTTPCSDLLLTQSTGSMSLAAASLMQHLNNVKLGHASNKQVKAALSFNGSLASAPRIGISPSFKKLVAIKPTLTNRGSHLIVKASGLKAPWEVAPPARLVHSYIPTGNHIC